MALAPLSAPILHHPSFGVSTCDARTVGVSTTNLSALEQRQAASPQF